MTTIVKKYELPVSVSTDYQLILPLGAQILNVREAGNAIGLWIRQDNDEPLEQRSFIVTADNGEAPKHALYIGTAWFSGTPRHVFDGATK